MSITTYDTLVLSGAGAKGVIELGALLALSENGVTLSNIKKYSGTSIGAVICLQLLIGYTPMAIFTEIYNFNILEGQEINVKRFANSYGLFSMDSFLERIKALITKKINCIPTLKELYDITTKDYFVCASSVDGAHYFNWRSDPDISVIDAVRFSCLIPCVFERVKYNNKYYFDGALVDNVPITPVKENREAIGQSSDNIIAIEVVGKEVYNDDLWNYIYQSLFIPINELQYLHRKLYPDVKRIIIEYTQVDKFDLQPSKEKKLEMFMYGYTHCKFDTAATI
jgi:predicted acylesterase/phospholipase RssA